MAAGCGGRRFFELAGISALGYKPEMPDDLLERYLAVNSRFRRPFLFKLTRRGFYSEVNNLLNAMLWGLSRRRRLIVDESDFEGLRWSDFFTSTLPTAPEEMIKEVPAEWVINGSESLMFHKMASYAERRHNRPLPVWYPSMGLFGNLRQIKRKFSEAFTTPRIKAEIPLHPYACFHIRRGDKLHAVLEIDRSGNSVWMREGDDILPEAYVSFLRSEAPDVRSIFVMTDDYTMVEDLRVAAPDYDVSSLTTPDERGYQQPNFSAELPSIKAKKLERLLLETQIAMASDIFLGGFKSNVARFIALRHDRPERCFSLDGWKTWHPK